MPRALYTRRLSKDPSDGKEYDSRPGSQIYLISSNYRAVFLSSQDGCCSFLSFDQNWYLTLPLASILDLFNGGTLKDFKDYIKCDIVRVFRPQKQCITFELVHRTILIRETPWAMNIQ